MGEKRPYRPFIPWTEEELQAIRDMGQVGVDEGYERFNALFPGKRTKTAYTNVRSRHKLVSFKQIEHSGRGWQVQPIGAEHEKKGYIYVKIAQPDIWVSKFKYVYMQTHPDYIPSKEDQFITLDGNRRNFDPDNIYLMKKREAAIFVQYGGNKSGDPEITKLNVIRARLKLAMLDQAEKIGQVTTYTKGRRLKGDKRNVRH